MEYDEKCLICLKTFNQQSVATLDNCHHVFCLECILQWSKNANSCPVDRIDFNVIYQREGPRGDIQRIIKVKRRRQFAGEEQEEVEGAGLVTCEACGRSDWRHLLVLCVSCDSAYHTDCLRPQLDTVPETDWLCQECAASGPNTGGATEAGEEEVSDGELTELLSEAAADAVTASSWLRTSTTQQSRGTTGTRHSKRIRARAARNPIPWTHNSLHVPKYLLKPFRTVDSTSELFGGNLRESCGSSTSQTSPTTSHSPRPNKPKTGYVSQ